MLTPENIKKVLNDKFTMMTVELRRLIMKHLAHYTVLDGDIDGLTLSVTKAKTHDLLPSLQHLALPYHINIHVQFRTADGVEQNNGLFLTMAKDDVTANVVPGIAKMLWFFDQETLFNQPQLSTSFYEEWDVLNKDQFQVTEITLRITRGVFNFQVTKQSTISYMAGFNNEPTVLSPATTPIIPMKERAVERGYSFLDMPRDALNLNPIKENKDGK